MDMRKLLFGFYCMSSIGLSLHAVSLHRSARLGSTKLVRRALDRGDNVNMIDEEGKTPLHKAASGGHPNVVQLLLERGANVAARDDQFQTPLHKAARSLGRAGNKLTAKKRAEVISNLTILYSPDANARDNKERTPLHYIAAWAASPEGTLMPQAVRRDVWDHLISGIVSLRSLGVDFNAQDKFGKTPLHYAVEGGSIFLVDRLLFLGAKDDVKDNKDKVPADYAHGEMLEFFRRREKKKSPEAEGGERAMSFVERVKAEEESRAKMKSLLRRLEELQGEERHSQQTPQASNIVRSRRRSPRDRRARLHRA